MYSMPHRSNSRVATASGMADPPPNTFRSDERSRSATAGCDNRSATIVGTLAQCVQP